VCYPARLRPLVPGRTWRALFFAGVMPNAVDFLLIASGAVIMLHIAMRLRRFIRQ
jgi:hypothetical protein